MTVSSGPDAGVERTAHALDASEEAFAGGRWRPRRAWDEDPAVADEAAQRVIVIGDIHNNAGVLEGALRVAERERCDAVVSVGDFWLQDCSWGTRPCTHLEGYPSLPWSPLMRLAMRAPLPVIVIDGNHEAWPCLTEFAQRPDVVDAREAGRPLHLGGSLWWADRGSTWTWGGIRCGALGGAVSPDKFIERLAPYRWPDHEAPSRDDLARLLANAPDGLDVLFCHDAPAGVRGLRGMPDALIPTWILAECKEGSWRVSAVCVGELGVDAPVAPVWVRLGAFGGLFCPVMRSGGALAGWCGAVVWFSGAAKPTVLRRRLLSGGVVRC